MKRTRSVRLLVAVLSLLLLLTACTSVGPGSGSGGQTAGRKVQGSLVYASTDNPVSLNPILLTDNASYWVVERVFSSLIAINEKLQPVPDIAASWSTSSDGLQWTFKLRQDVKFHDGVQLTAEDVAYTYNAILDKGYTGYYGAAFKWLDRAEVVDPYTVKFILKQPYAPVLTTLTFGILPKHLYGDKPVAEMKDNPTNRKPVGSGPWKFGEWVTGQYISLTRNDAYYGGGPYIPDVRLKFVSDTNVAVAQLEAGEVDAMLLPGKDVKRLASSQADKLGFYKYEGVSFDYVCFNLTKPGLQDKAVRQAIAYAVDRQKMVNDILEGEAVVLAGPEPPSSWVYTTEGITNYVYNPKQAATLLEQAGYQKGADGIYAKNGQRLSYSIVIASGRATHESVALLMQKELKDVGIELKIEPVDSAVMLEKYVYVGNFDMFLSGMGVSVDPDQYTFFHSSQAQKNSQGKFVGYNRGQYINPAVDKLLEQGRTEADQSKRKSIYADYQRIIADDVPWLILYSPKSTYAIRSRVKGVIAGPMGPIKSWTWYIDQP